MKILIRNARIHQPNNPLHGQQTDILIEEGIIRKIGQNLPAQDCRVVEYGNLHVSAGWMDCFANFCDPGFEYKEDMASGARAAAAGGYTDVMLIPNTLPVISNKSQVEYLIKQSADTPVYVHPIGTISRNAEEKELSEMYDMAQAGALAFSDGHSPVQSSGMLQKALEYILAFHAVIIQLPDDRSIGTHGLMSEGVISTRLGLQGKPAIAEEIMVARDIELVRYTGSRIHLTGISTRKSLELIAAAKAEGLPVTCSATPYHLLFCDEDLEGYDTNLKVNPPLRTRDDRDALADAVKNGTVDFIASHHQPEDYDHKVCEFEKADFGMETLESVFGAAQVSGISTNRFITMQTESIRKIFGLPAPEIKEGNEARLTLFDPDAAYYFSEENIYSQSVNNAFINKQLRGKVFGIVNKGRLFGTKRADRN